MARYSIANRTSDVTTAHPCLEVIAGTNGCKVVEIGITIDAATASLFGIGLSAAVGLTPTTPLTLLAETPGRPASLTKTALAWATAPTIPAAFSRRVNFPATAGATVVLSFPHGIPVATAQSLVIWNLSAVSVADVYVVVEE